MNFKLWQCLIVFQHIMVKNLVPVSLLSSMTHSQTYYKILYVLYFYKIFSHCKNYKYRILNRFEKDLSIIPH